MPANFGYWNIRGLGQDIRLLLEYTGQEYEERIYNVRPNDDRSDWLDEKFTFGLDFPNLPYYIDGDVKLTQSAVILRYIARKHKLCGENDKEETILEMLHAQLADMRLSWAMLVYNPKFKSLKEAYITETFPASAERLSKYLGEKTWLIGNRITYVDFFAYELLYVNSVLMPDYLDRYANLKAYLRRFQELGPIKKYMGSSNFIESPINAWFAYFASK